MISEVVYLHINPEIEAPLPSKRMQLLDGEIFIEIVEMSLVHNNADWPGTSCPSRASKKV